MALPSNRLTMGCVRTDAPVMTSGGSRTTALDRADLVIVGAGIVGLAHAVHAVDRGLSVVIVERDQRAVGASIRNFGHGCFTAQDGDALRFAGHARKTWLRLARAADFSLSQSGTVVVARAEDEMAVLEDFHASRGDEVVMLDARAVRAKVATSAAITGGASLPRDIRVDPRSAIPAIADWLSRQGVRFHWGTAMHGADADGVTTSRGRVQAGHVVVAVGHDVDRHFPDIAERIGLRRCVLHMLRTDNPLGSRIGTAVLRGWSMLRYDGFAISPSLQFVRDRLHAELPNGEAWGLNLMFTQRPDGDLTIGDTHDYSLTPGPFQTEERDTLILDQVARLLGTARPHVRERWQGVYASAANPFLVADLEPNVRIVSVTSGIGMTTAFGLSADVLDDLLTDTHPSSQINHPERETRCAPEPSTPL